MSSISAIFFDLDNTLADDSGSLKQSLEKTLPLISERYPELTLTKVFQEFRIVNTWHWENYDQSPIGKMKSAQDVRSHIAAETLEALGHPDMELACTMAQIFQAARRETYECYLDTMPVLQSLKEKYSLVIVTNGNSEMQREKIAKCGLEKVMNAIFIAQETGFSKPSPEIFHKAMQSVKVKPETSLMVGDHAEKDIQGAKAVGMQTAWIRREDRSAEVVGSAPDYIVRTMTEIQEIVEQND
jgi:phosphoserine phosphatase